MDRDQASRLEPEELTPTESNPGDTETSSEYASHSEGGAAAASNTQDTSDSSPGEAISKEEVEKAMEEIISQMNLMQLPPTVTKCMGAEANPGEGVLRFATKGGKPKSSRSIRKFLRSRLKHLRKVYDDMQTVKKFMLQVTDEITLAERPGPDEELVVNLSDKWSHIYDRWESVHKYLDDAMVKTKNMMDYDGNTFTLTDIEMYIDSLSLLQIYLHELAVWCSGSLDKYRHICDQYIDYLFMCHINTLPIHYEDLHNRLSLELDEFGSYYHQPESEDSE